MIVPADPGEPHVESFALDVVPGNLPFQLLSRPLPGAPMNECTQVIAQHVAQHGGRTVLGWALWERPGVFIEAEFHAVWEPPGGEMIDLMPRPRGFSTITFVPDPRLVDDGRNRDNTRKALVRDPDVIRYLFLFRQDFEMLNKGKRVFEREVTLTETEMRQRRDLLTEQARLQLRLDKRYGP